MIGRTASRALFVVSVIFLPMTFGHAQAPQPPAQPPLPAPGPASKVAFVVKDRHGHAVPERIGTTHTGGGNTDVAQPRDDTLIITMTGVAVAGPHPCKESSAVVSFDLNQEVEIALADPKLRKARLIIEAQIVGLLRGDKHGGSASVCNGTASLVSGSTSIAAVAIEGHAVGGEDSLAINDHRGPVAVPVLPGEYQLFQTFRISAAHARGIVGKAASAEFAPDPALDPTWISVTEPFHGAVKKEFGFRVILRLEPE
jgi:hypothetical protein